MPLDQLPPEILEQIGLFLPARSVSALKCVNKDFNDIFNSDVFWKKYLYYSEKYFKSDIQSESPDPAVAEVVSDISTGAVGRWRGCYRLQQARLHTWLSRDADQHDVVPLTPGHHTTDILDMQEMVDVWHQRWLFVLTRNKTRPQGGDDHRSTLHIWNITTTPTPLPPVQMRWAIQIFILMPEGKVVLVESLRGHITCFIGVYRFEYPTYNLEVQFKFCYEAEVSSDQMLQNWVEDDFGYVIVKDVCITYKIELTPSNVNEGALVIWNLKSGVKLATVSIHQDCIVEQFTDYLKTTRFGSGPLYEINLYPGNSSKIIVVLKKSEDASQINIFYLETMTFSAPVLQTCAFFTDFHMFADKLCVQQSFYEYESAGFGYGHTLMYPSVLIYSLETDPKLLKTIHSVYVRPDSDSELSDPTEINSKIIFINSKVLVQNGTMVEIWSLDTDPLKQQKVILYGGYILSYLEPQLLLVYDKFILPNGGVAEGKMKVINTVDGIEVCQWRNALYGIALSKYYKQLQYPTKIVYCVGNELHLYVK